MNRAEAIQSGKCCGTLEMLGFLVEETGLPKTLCEAVIEAWIDTLRSAVSTLVEQDRRYGEHLQQGRAVLIVRNLVPIMYIPKRTYLIARCSKETGASRRAVEEALCGISSQLEALCGDKAFEPLGWIEDSGSGFYLVIRLWSDFLQPKDDAPIE